MSKELWEMQRELWESQQKINTSAEIQLKGLIEIVGSLTQIVQELTVKVNAKPRTEPGCTGKQCRCGKVAH